MHLNKKIKRRFKLIIGSLFAQFAVPLSNIGVSILVVRWFSEELWGRYVAHLLVLGLCLTIINWGSKDFLLKRFSKHPKNISEVLWAAILGKTVLAILTCLCLYFLPLGTLNKPLLVCWVGARVGWQFFESLNTYRRLFVPVAIAEGVFVAGMMTGMVFLEMTIDLLLLFFILTDILKIFFYAWLNRAYLKWPTSSSLRLDQKGKSEGGSWKSEVGSWKSERGRGKLEGGSEKSEVGSGKGRASGVFFRLGLLTNLRQLAWPTKAVNVAAFFKESFPFFLLTIASLAASRADLYLLGIWKDNATLAQYQILVSFIQYAHLLATAMMIPFLKNIFRLEFKSIAQLERQFMALGAVLAIFLTGGILFITYFLYQFELSKMVILLIYLNILIFYSYFLRIPAGFSFDKMWQVILIMCAMGAINLSLGCLIIPSLGMLGGLLSSLGASVIGCAGFRHKKLFNFQ